MDSLLDRNDHRTILLAVPQGFAARYLLRTAILDTLLSGGARVVALVPNPDERYLRDELEPRGVTLEALRAAEGQTYIKTNPWHTRLQLLRTFGLAHGHQISTLQSAYRRNRRNWSRGKVNEVVIDLMLQGLWRSRLLRRLLIETESRLFPGHLHRPVFEKYRPQLVVTTSLGYFPLDALVLREARTHAARTAAVILSWDNTSSKGLGGAPVDHVVAWTEHMRDELLRYHDVPSERVFVGGIAHFDVYARPEALPDRAETFQRFGLDPARRLLFFATHSPAQYPSNPDLVRIIGRAIDEDRFSAPCQLLVRPHPIYFRPGEQSAMAALRAAVDAHPHVHLNTPNILSERLYCDLAPSETEDLAAILKHSDVVINVFSTIALEASLVDRPLVNVGFDLSNDANVRTPSVYREFAHIRRVVDTGAVRIATSEQDLTALIDMYVQDPTLDREGRRRLVEGECGPFLGRAGERIGQHLLQLLASARAGRAVGSA